ncbi:PIG-P-domain-containing protein [Haematococcus lacustris]
MPEKRSDGPPATPASVEVYGFAGWLGAMLGGGLFLLWSLLPDRTLEWFGVHYYPTKCWAVILPAWCLAALVYVYWLYEGLNQASVLPPTSLLTLQDEHCKEPRATGLTSLGLGPGGRIQPLAHIPPDLVAQVLYAGKTMAEASCMALGSSQPGAEANAPEARQGAGGGGSGGQ